MSTETTKAPAAAVESPAGLTHKQIRVILLGLMAGMLLAALDQTIVSTSIRTIADDLQGLSAMAWVTTAYLITSTVTTPLYGKLSDIYGRRPMFLTAISIFIFGSILCTFSTSMYELAAFRAVQGIGAGGLFSMALAILADIVPPRQRAKYQGYFLAVFGMSSVIGPLVGGFFAGADTIFGITGWRWVFLVNVPIGIIALVVVAHHAAHPAHPHRPPDRLVGRRRADARHRAAADRGRTGPHLGLGLRERPGSDRARHHRRRRVHPDRGPDEGRGADPHAAVPAAGCSASGCRSTCWSASACSVRSARCRCTCSW